MNNFILGYNKPEDEYLTSYKSVEQAEYYAEEWCIISANTLELAKLNYEETFQEYKNNGMISGAFSNS